MQELKAFRATLSTEQWQGWLQFARDEKQKLRARRVSPPEPSVLTKDPEQLLRAIMKTEEAKVSSEPNGERSPLHEIPRPSTEPIVVPEIRSENGAPEVGARELMQKSQRTLVDQNTTANSFAHGTTERSPWELGPQQRSDSDDVRRLVSQSRNVAGAAGPQNRSPAPWVAPKDFERDHYPAPENSTQGARKAEEGGVSLALGMIRRSSRGRASSAPRDRPAPSVRFGASSHSSRVQDHNDYHYGSLSTHKLSPSHSPKLKHSHHEDFFGGSGRAMPRGHGRNPQSPARTQYFHLPGTPAGPYSSRASRLQHHAGSPLVTSLDLADAAEIARSTAFRLDSAYSAAQCLLSTFAADQQGVYLATGGDSGSRYDSRVGQEK